MATGLTGLGTRKRSRRFPLVPLMAWLFIFLSAGLFSFELIRFSQQADTISADVTVAGVNVGGLSPAEAVARWEQIFAQPLVLWYDSSPILLDPAAIGFQTNRESMLAAARAASVNEASFWPRFFNHLTGVESREALNIELSATYQETQLERILQDIAARYDRPPGPADFDVQTLTIRPGAMGFTLDIERALPLIDRALRSPTDRQVVLPVTGTDASRPDIRALRELIIAYLDSQGFIYDGQSTVASVFIMDLQTGDEVHILSDVAFSAASTIKMGILIDFYRDLLFQPNDDYAFLMVQSLLCSNNSSSNLIMQIIGRDNLFAGIAQVTNTMQYIGARNTYISAPLYLGGDQVLGSIPAPRTSPNPNFNTGADPYNQTTTEDLGTMLTMIYDCAYYGSGLMAAYPNGEFTQNECRQMLNLMAANDLERLLQAGIPPGTPIAHKNGWLHNVHGDAGIVFPPNGRNYVIAVYVWENTEFFSYTRAWPLIEGISRAAWNFFSPESPLIAPRTDIPDTARDCEDFSPPYGQVNLDDINAWRAAGTSIP
ncbi:MAG: serine hydrolase [Aggregatilineales bacterium]